MTAKTSLLNLGLPAILVAFATCSAPVWADTSNVAFATAHVHEQLNFFSFYPSPMGSGASTGTGNVNGLPITMTATDDITGSADFSHFSFSNGKMAITTADGDVLRIDYSGTLRLNQTHTGYNISGTFMESGGTGQFFGANGSGSLTGTEGFPDVNLQTNGEFALTLDKPVSVAAVPEPETYALMLAGLGALGGLVRRRRPA